jgi:hypothetical protein
MTALPHREGPLNQGIVVKTRRACDERTWSKIHPQPIGIDGVLKIVAVHVNAIALEFQMEVTNYPYPLPLVWDRIGN